MIRIIDGGGGRSRDHLRVVSGDGVILPKSTKETGTSRRVSDKLLLLAGLLQAEVSLLDSEYNVDRIKVLLQGIEGVVHHGRSKYVNKRR
jgi:hypothetical protein